MHLLWAKVIFVSRYLSSFTFLYGFMSVLDEFYYFKESIMFCFIIEEKNSWTYVTL